MNKIVKRLVIGLVLVGVLAIGIGAGVVSAATPTPTPATPAYCGPGGGFRFGGILVDDVISKLLGMTADQIRTLRQEGKSLVQIAATKNVTEKQLVDAINAYKKTAVQNRVTAGTLTQDQANLILQQMQQQTTQAVNRTTTGPMGAGAGCGLAGGNGPVTGGQAGRGAGAGMMNRGRR